MTTAPLRVSFRDPDGSLVIREDAVYRLVSNRGLAVLESLMQSKFATSLFQQGKVVETRILSDAEKTRIICDDNALLAYYESQKAAGLVEHRRIWFPSFPYEWPAEMLCAAAELTLELAVSGLDEGYGLKDATPLNVLFEGPRPVFVDLLSFEKRDPHDPRWLPYAQFIRTFLLPLLASTYFGVSLANSLLSRRDGIEPESFYKLLNPLDRLRPRYFSCVSVAVWLSRSASANKSEIYKPKRVHDSRRAEFTLRALVSGLSKAILRAKPKNNVKSTWSQYMEASQNNYSSAQFDAKKEFVRRALASKHPKRVLDVGCNTGEFSVLAAQAGASVVAIDYDPVVVGRVWHWAKREGLQILPLVVDLARPTPPTGWMNGEAPSFLQRAEGAFDMVMMLAVMHHVLVTERVPLDQVLTLASGLTREWLLLEFVEPDDGMFRRLSRGRDHLYEHLTVKYFETVLPRYFRIEESLQLPGANRRLYLLQKQA